LHAIAEQYPDTLSITIALSDEDLDSHDTDQPDNIMFTSGLVHEAARQCQIEKDNCMAYIAGPPPMVDGALRDLLTQAGYSAAQIRYDKFG